MQGISSGILKGSRLQRVHSSVSWGFCGSSPPDHSPLPSTPSRGRRALRPRTTSAGHPAHKTSRPSTHFRDGAAVNQTREAAQQVQRPRECTCRLTGASKALQESVFLLVGKRQYIYTPRLLPTLKK